MHTVTPLRRRTPRRALAVALCAVAVPALGLSACGDSVPSSAVAKVGDTTITNATFDHWLRIAAISSQGPAQGGNSPAVSIPKPPEFTECVANKAKSAPKPAKGQPKPTNEDFKKQCKLEYEGLRDQVMQLLIQNQWVTNEAKAQGVKVTDAEVKKAFDQQKKQSFPKEKDYQKFLKTSGFTEQDILFRVRLETLSNKLRDKVLKGKDKVTDKEISDYYNKNKQRFAQPERRDLRIVLTKDKAKADEAKQAIQSGQPWKAVAKKYSVDQASKGQGGVLLAVAKGQQEPALDKAVFAAKKGALTGPIKTQFGYYVFAVQKVTPKSQQSLAQAKASIKAILQSQGQQKALDTFIKDFQKKWRSKTNCRKGYVTQDCKNAPKQSGSTAAPSGTATTGTPTTGSGSSGGTTTNK